jgi:hypothetical protein
MNVDPKATRGYRNRNPGNIEHVPANQWQGLADPLSDGRFCRFTSHEFGIRALAALLVTYQDRHKLRTPRAIIERWAPKVENDTAAYVALVAQRIGVGPDDAIDLHRHAQLRPLVEAIIRHECAGLAYPAGVIDRALTLAGVPPAAPVTLREVAAVTGTGRGAVLVGTAGIATAVAQAAPAIAALHSRLVMSLAARNPAPVVLRGETIPQRISAGGLVVVRDGETVEEMPILSPLAWQIEHRTEVEITVAGATPAARNALLDALMVDVATAITATELSGALWSGRSPAALPPRMSSSRALPRRVPPPSPSPCGSPSPARRWPDPPPGESPCPVPSARTAACSCCPKPPMAPPPAATGGACSSSPAISAPSSRCSMPT